MARASVSDPPGSNCQPRRVRPSLEARRIRSGRVRGCGSSPLAGTRRTSLSATHLDRIPWSPTGGNKPLTDRVYASSGDLLVLFMPASYPPGPMPD